MARYKLKLVDTNKQDFLEKLEVRVKGYLVQLTEQFKKLKEQDNKIENLTNEIKEIKDILIIKEESRRKNASKIGGLQTSLNKEKTKTKELLENQIILENKINENNNKMELKDLEIKTKDAEIKMLRGKGKKKNIEDYKNFVECRKELEKRKKNGTI